MKHRALKMLLPLVALLSAGVPVAGYGQQPRKLGGEDLAALVSHYVDSSVEARQFIAACAMDKRPGWDEGAAMLVASLRAVGFQAADDMAQRLASDGAAVPYDCANASSKLRIEGLMPGDWSEIHRRLLQAAGIQEVAASIESDPKIVAVRAAISAHVGPQADVLNCMSRIQTEFFPLAWVDWNEALDRAAVAILNAGYPEDIARDVTEDARSDKLMRPVADRQAEIAACAADEGWLTRVATFAWYTVVGDVEKALGVKN